MMQRPPSLALLISHAYEIEKSDPEIFIFLKFYPTVKEAARAVIIAHRTRQAALTELADTFRTVLADAANAWGSRPTGKATNGRAKDRLEQVKKAREEKAAKEAARRTIPTTQLGLFTGLQ